MGSVDFQAGNIEVWKEAKHTKESKLQLWLAYTIAGFLTGLCAFLADFLVTSGQAIKWTHTQAIIDNHAGLFKAFLCYLSYSVLFGGLASAMTCYIGPAAAGSGTAEFIGYLNGIFVPGFI